MLSSRRRRQVAVAYAMAPAAVLVLGVLAYPVAWELWASLTDFSTRGHGAPAAVNDFMLASIFLLDPTKQTVAAGLGVMDLSLEELVAVAGVNPAAIPLVAVCALFARTYVRGLTAAMLEGA